MTKTELRSELQKLIATGKKDWDTTWKMQEIETKIEAMQSTKRQKPL